MKELDNVTRKRLVYVKRLHMHAQEHVLRESELDRMLAILHLDNVVELLLKCVAAEYEISLGDPTKLRFDKLWSIVEDEYQERTKHELPDKAQLFRMHRIRGDVQHWGTSPFSLEYIRDLEAETHQFMQIILNSVFGLEYEELFMSSLVNDAKLRDLLKEAEEYFADEKWKEALAKVSFAFALAMKEAQRRRYLPIAPRTLGQLGLVSENSDERVGILALGLDLEDYKRFIESTPAVPFVSLGEQDIQWTRELNLSKENTLFCLNFALDALARWDL